MGRRNPKGEMSKKNLGWGQLVDGMFAQRAQGSGFYAQLQRKEKSTQIGYLCLINILDINILDIHSKLTIN